MPSDPNVVNCGSPVLKVVNKYGLRYVLIRGRHLIGPNPSLVHIVEGICEKSTPESALDLFSGTGIIPIVLSRHGVYNITCVDKGPHFSIVKDSLKTAKWIKCINDDAFSFSFSDTYDLIIADPYYQDALNFLNNRINEIYQKTQTFVFVCCGAENEYLRAQCRNVIKAYFKTSTEEKILWGQSIFISNK